MIGLTDALIEAAKALAAHGYWRDPQVGGRCPACDHVYYERRPSAYMDPDLDWLRVAIDRHRAQVVLDAVAPAIASQALRDAAREALQRGDIGCPDDDCPTVWDWLCIRADQINPKEES